MDCNTNSEQELQQQQQGQQQQQQQDDGLPIAAINNSRQQLPLTAEQEVLEHNWELQWMQLSLKQRTSLLQQGLQRQHQWQQQQQLQDLDPPISAINSIRLQLMSLQAEVAQLLGEARLTQMDPLTLLDGLSQVDPVDFAQLNLLDALALLEYLVEEGCLLYGLELCRLLHVQEGLMLEYLQQQQGQQLQQQQQLQPQDHSIGSAGSGHLQSEESHVTGDNAGSDNECENSHVAGDSAGSDNACEESHGAGEDISWMDYISSHSSVDFGHIVQQQQQQGQQQQQHGQGQQQQGHPQQQQGHPQQQLQGTAGQAEQQEELSLQLLLLQVQQLGQQQQQQHGQGQQQAMSDREENERMLQQIQQDHSISADSPPLISLDSVIEPSLPRSPLVESPRFQNCSADPVQSHFGELVNYSSEGGSTSEGASLTSDMSDDGDEDSTDETGTGMEQISSEDKERTPTTLCSAASSSSGPESYESYDFLGGPIFASPDVCESPDVGSSQVITESPPDVGSSQVVTESPPDVGSSQVITESLPDVASSQVITESPPDVGSSQVIKENTSGDARSRKGRTANRANRAGNGRFSKVKTAKQDSNVGSSQVNIAVGMKHKLHESGDEKEKEAAVAVYDDVPQSEFKRQKTSLVPYKDTKKKKKEIEKKAGKKDKTSKHRQAHSEKSHTSHFNKHDLTGANPAPSVSQQQANPALTGASKGQKPAPSVGQQQAKPALTGASKGQKPAPSVGQQQANPAPSVSQQHAKPALTGASKQQKNPLAICIKSETPNIYPSTSAATPSAGNSHEISGTGLSNNPTGADSAKFSRQNNPKAAVSSTESGGTPINSNTAATNKEMLKKGKKTIALEAYRNRKGMHPVVKSGQSSACSSRSSSPTNNSSSKKPFTVVDNNKLLKDILICKPNETTKFSSLPPILTTSADSSRSASPANQNNPGQNSYTPGVSVLSQHALQKAKEDKLALETQRQAERKKTSFSTSGHGIQTNQQHAIINKDLAPHLRKRPRASTHELAIQQAAPIQRPRQPTQQAKGAGEKPRRQRQQSGGRASTHVQQHQASMPQTTRPANRDDTQVFNIMQNSLHLQHCKQKQIISTSPNLAGTILSLPEEPAVTHGGSPFSKNQLAQTWKPGQSLLENPSQAQGTVKLANAGHNVQQSTACSETSNVAQPLKLQTDEKTMTTSGNNKGLLIRKPIGPRMSNQVTTSMRNIPTQSAPTHNNATSLSSSSTPSRKTQVPQKNGVVENGKIVTINGKVMPSMIMVHGLPVKVQLPPGTVLPVKVQLPPGTIKGNTPPTTIKGNTPPTTIKGNTPPTTTKGNMPPTTMKGNIRQPGTIKGNILPPGTIKGNTPPPGTTVVQSKAKQNGIPSVTVSGKGSLPEPIFQVSSRAPIKITSVGGVQPSLLSKNTPMTLVSKRDELNSPVLVHMNTTTQSAQKSNKYFKITSGEFIPLTEVPTVQQPVPATVQQPVFTNIVEQSVDNNVPSHPIPTISPPTQQDKTGNASTKPGQKRLHSFNGGGPPEKLPKAYQTNTNDEAEVLVMNKLPSYCTGNYKAGDKQSSTNARYKQLVYSNKDMCFDREPSPNRELLYDKLPYQLTHYTNSQQFDDLTEEVQAGGRGTAEDRQIGEKEIFIAEDLSTRTVTISSSSSQVEKFTIPKLQRQSPARSRSPRYSSAGRQQYSPEQQRYTSSPHRSRRSRSGSRSTLSGHDRNSRPSYRSRSRSRSRSPGQGRSGRYRQPSKYQQRSDDYSKEDFKRNNPPRRPQADRTTIMHVGDLPDYITEDILEEMFERYGEIVKCSVKTRKPHEDGWEPPVKMQNYGFVQFRHEQDAYNAIKKGNKEVPNAAEFQLSYGDRKGFLNNEQYVDLDNVHDVDEDLTYYRQKQGRGQDSFDDLLKEHLRK